MDEGYVKFFDDRTEAEIPDSDMLQTLNNARALLVECGLIGCDPAGVGFGNLSMRHKDNQFIVSASATGSLPQLLPHHFSLVESIDTERNSIRSRGKFAASSESMTHGAVYAACAAAQCVIHVHDRALFAWLMRDGGVATSKEAAYGTPAMASAVTMLIQEHPALPMIFAMAGHAEGVIAYGESIESTLELVLRLHTGTLTT